MKPRAVLPFRDTSQARGPLLTPQAVADLIGGVSEAWVRRNVPGAPESRIQQSLRHRSPAMTRRYTRMVDKGENARIVGSVLVPPEHLQIVADAASGA